MEKARWFTEENKLIGQQIFAVSPRPNRPSVVNLTWYLMVKQLDDDQLNLLLFAECPPLKSYYTNPILSTEVELLVSHNIFKIIKDMYTKNEDINFRPKFIIQILR
jgi:hypothetical protein